MKNYMPDAVHYRRIRKRRKDAFVGRAQLAGSGGRADLMATKRMRSVRIKIESTWGGPSTEHVDRFYALIDLDDHAVDQLIGRLQRIRGGKRARQ